MLPCFFVDCGYNKRIAQLRYAEKFIVNIMKVYIERKNLQLELIRYSVCERILFYSCLLLQTDGFAHKPTRGGMVVSYIVTYLFSLCDLLYVVFIYFVISYILHSRYGMNLRWGYTSTMTHLAFGTFTFELPSCQGRQPAPQLAMLRTTIPSILGRSTATPSSSSYNNQGVLLYSTSHLHPQVITETAFKPIYKRVKSKNDGKSRF